ncbi:hypothetical protein PR048_033421 [Dryococelus australis]|uniref:Histone-lysine N-methyltransferase, H3 lysine-36 and H4 lysine-20 specific n=1 Tax=Dryococelus australis TaxID=614101 RepID=A0ABQ9G082_9NEOP|nr:hypothetical protein PR048_033421 [Dryococelus australis]
MYVHLIRVARSPTLVSAIWFKMLPAAVGVFDIYNVQRDLRDTTEVVVNVRGRRFLWGSLDTGLEGFWKVVVVLREEGGCQRAPALKVMERAAEIELLPFWGCAPGYADRSWEQAVVGSNPARGDLMLHVDEAESKGCVAIRWWPAQIVFPDQVPENIENLQHSDGEFVVRFFGSHDYNWVNRSRVFLYQEGIHCRVAGRGHGSLLLKLGPRSSGWAAVGRSLQDGGQRPTTAVVTGPVHLLKRRDNGSEKRQGGHFHSEILPVNEAMLLKLAFCWLTATRLKNGMVVHMAIIRKFVVSALLCKFALLCAGVSVTCLCQDSAYKKSGKTSVDTVFLRAVNEAQDAHKELNLAKASREAEPRQALKPPQYIKIKCNKPVGNVRVMECDSSNLVPCYCDPKKANPCGPDSDCLNRILMVECSPAVCRAKDKCRNQRFEKREYPPLLPYKTEGRGWGLKTLADIKKGDFVIEYVGEMIDEAEYKRRLEKKHLEKDENYYFLTIDKDRMLDAGPKGNVSRFMNHSCQPNCETQKWTVNGDTRVGLFALEDIPANIEVTFNYNLQCASTEKKKCMCGAPNCSGFIGSKASKVVDEEKKRLDSKGKKKQRNSNIPKPGGECFQCGQNGDLIACYNKTCPKKYHLKCVNLSKPSKGKWTCPWHQCNVCKKHRTSKRCSLCPNAYCAQHEEGNIYSTTKEMYCMEHTQGSVTDGSSRSTSRMSTDGSDVQQPISSYLSGRSGEAASGDRGSRASCSKYQTSAEQMAARDSVGTRRGVDSVDRTSPLPHAGSSAQVIITEVLPGAVRKSARKSQSLYKELPRKGAKAGGIRADSHELGSVVDCGHFSLSGPEVSLSSSKFTEEASMLTDVWLALTDDEVSGSSVKDNSFCEFQESRRKDLLEMRRAQHKRIGQKVTEMCQAKVGI